MNDPLTERSTQPLEPQPSPSARDRASSVAHAKREGQAELILQQLTLRFGKLPAPAVQRVREGSLADLRRWATRVLILPTLDDVLAPRLKIDGDPKASIFNAIAHAASKEVRKVMLDVAATLEGRGTMPGDWARGEAYGRQYGRQLGMTDGQAKLLLYLLDFRFGRVPQRFARRVQACVEREEPARLYGWAARLLTAPTLDSVFSGR